MADSFVKVFVGVVLLICGLQDIRNKKVHLWVIILGALLVGVGIPFCNTFSILDRLGGVAVGAVVIIISALTSGKIGMGDGLLLCVTGLSMGFWGNLELFALALFLAAVLSIVLLVFRLADRKKCIPFVPFLLFSYLFLMIAKMNNGA